MGGFGGLGIIGGLLTYLALQATNRRAAASEEAGRIERETKEEAEKAETVLRASPEWALVQGFLRRHSNEFSTVEGDYAALERADVKPLVRLLESKGHSIQEDALAGLLWAEVIRGEVQELGKRIAEFHPTSTIEYVEALARIHGNNAPAWVQHLEVILGEANLAVTEDLDGLVRDAQARLEMADYEKRLREATASRTTLKDADRLSGREFETLLHRVYARAGYQVKGVGGVGDQGADLVLEGRGERIVVQAKRSAAPVGNWAIQEAAASVRHYGAQRAIVVTNHSFTRGAIELAVSNGIELVDGNHLQASRQIRVTKGYRCARGPPVFAWLAASKPRAGGWPILPVASSVIWCWTQPVFWAAATANLMYDRKCAPKTVHGLVAVHHLRC